jgi:hypothetical protein
MKLKSHRILLPLITLMIIFSVCSCASRLPKDGSAKNAIQSYFSKYGKRYPDSDFGRHKIDDVEITGKKELQKELVFVEAYVSLDEGTVVYKINATLLKKTLFWKLVSWENIGRS